MITKFRKIEKVSTGSRSISIIFGGIVLLIIGFLFIANLNLFQKSRRLNKRLSLLQNKAKYLKEQNKKLKDKNSQLSKKEYTEKLLRENGMYKKRGEGVVIVTRGDEKQKEEQQANFLKNNSTKSSAGVINVMMKIKDLFRVLNH